MPTAVQLLPINQIQELTLEQCISPDQKADIFPLICQLNEINLQIDSACTCISLPSTTTLNIEPVKSSKIELVVFSGITIKLLITLVLQCQLNLLAITAINHRNKLISYRLAVDCDDLNHARELLVSFTLQHRIEAALLCDPAKLTQPGVLVMDMDSTAIEIECIDEIAVLAGVGEEVAAITELAMQGELDFAQSLHQRVAKLADAPEKILADVAKKLPLMNGLKTLIAELKKYQWRIAIASGGFTYFADHLKEALQLDAAYANTLEIKSGKLTGKVLGDVVDAEVKAQSLKKMCQNFNIPHQQSVAMGDGANDLKMMAAAHLGVAFHAKPIVLKQADSSINEAGLDCLLHWLA